MGLVALVLVLLLAPLSRHAQEPLPILDRHLHAMAADARGPPPLGLCAPSAEFPVWDRARPYGEVLMGMLKQPPCADPVRSPTTDDGVMRQTVEVMERRNIVGVLSGSPERVAVWSAAAPGRFIPGPSSTAS